MKRRGNKLNRRPDVGPPPNRPDPVPVHAPVTARRKWLFRLIALSLPFIAVCILEAALRIGGYGYSTALFKPAPSAGDAMLEGNDQFCLRFFPPELARFPVPIRIEAQKPADTCRIFILGESAAMGDPEPAFGAGRYLQMLLSQRFPGERFEIVNLGITAINSHVILPIARACARQHGDFWIVYMGNNEMVGPYGAATVFGAQAPRWQLVRLGLAIQQTRTGQLLMTIARRLGGKSARTPSWMGMEMFARNRVLPNDPRKETVYNNFQRNLHDIVDCGASSGVRVLLNTVAVNLKDCPPFVSLDATNLPAADQSPFQKSCYDAARLETDGHFAEAAQMWAAAAKLAPLSAETQYHLGQCLLRITNAATALPALQAGCDNDALPFRADSRINGMIRQAAAEFAARGVELVDATTELETNGPSAVLGDETFFEHVHFNFDGNYRLARVWADEIARQLPPSATANKTPAWADQELCERRLGLTDWNRCNVIEGIIRRMQQAPLNSQANNGPRVAALRSEVAAMRNRMDASGVARAREIYIEALAHRPADHDLLENFADFLVATGDPKGAATQWEKVHALLPDDYLADFRLGNTYALNGQLAEAEASLTTAVTLRPDLADAWLTLGQTHAAQGKLEAALADYRHGAQLRPTDPEFPFNAGKALSLLKRVDEAMAEFRRAIELRPDYWEAHNALGGQLGLADRIDEAAREFQEVIRLKPDFAPAHLNLGVALMKAGRMNDAAREFQETLRLTPGDKVAADYLRQAHAR